MDNTQKKFNITGIRKKNTNQTTMRHFWSHLGHFSGIYYMSGIYLGFSTLSLQAAFSTSAILHTPS
jgi:hypothetical protein